MSTSVAHIPTITTYNMNLEIDGYEYQVKVTAAYHCSQVGNRGSCGEPLEPDTEEGAEVLSVHIQDSYGSWMKLPFFREVWRDLGNLWLDEFKAEYLGTLR